MSRAREKLYGDWQRWNDEHERTRPQRVRELLRDFVLIGALLAIGGAALLG